MKPLHQDNRKTVTAMPQKIIGRRADRVWLKHDPRCRRGSGEELRVGFDAVNAVTDRRYPFVYARLTVCEAHSAFNNQCPAA
jgi:hypothetical protein